MLKVNIFDYEDWLYLYFLICNDYILISIWVIKIVLVLFVLKYLFYKEEIEFDNFLFVWMLVVVFIDFFVILV